MTFLIGTMLILGIVAMVYLGPEFIVKFAGKPVRFRKLVRITNDQRQETVAGRRRNNRPGNV